MSEQGPESDHAARDDSGDVHVDIEDAGGRELRDVTKEPPHDEVEQIEDERERRLDADSRPDNAEVDNTGRDFDPETGMFTDSDEHDRAEQRYAPRADEG